MNLIGYNSVLTPSDNVVNCALKSHRNSKEIKREKNGLLYLSTHNTILSLTTRVRSNFTG